MPRAILNQVLRVICIDHGFDHRNQRNWTALVSLLWKNQPNEKKLLMKELERIQIKCKRFTNHKRGFMVEIFAMYENISDLF